MADQLLLATRKGILTFANKNGRWRRTAEQFLGIHASLIVTDPRNGTWWACLDHGHWGIKLHRSHDRGESWTEVEPPKFPAGCEIREGKSASVNYLWSLAPGGHDEAQRLYLGTVPGGLFISDDDGDTWRLHRPLWNHPSRGQWFGGGMDEAGIHSIIVDPHDSRHLFIGISCAGVLESTDHGDNWVIRNRGLRADFLPDSQAEIGHDPHLLVACPTDLAKMWQQNHCGVFRSGDAARNWQDVSQASGPVNFGFTVAVSETDGDVAWVIPAISDECRVAIDRKLAVCRTDDAGNSWQRFTTGLPQQDCYDFAFRHALAVRGDRLAFGTACGSAYVSDDRGESWQVIGRDLPPVYAVCLA